MRGVRSGAHDAPGAALAAGARLAEVEGANAAAARELAQCEAEIAALAEVDARCVARGTAEQGGGGGGVVTVEVPRLDAVEERLKANARLTEATFGALQDARMAERRVCGGAQGSCLLPPPSARLARARTRHAQRSLVGWPEAQVAAIGAERAAPVLAQFGALEGRLGAIAARDRCARRA